MAVYTIINRRTATSVAESYGLGKLMKVTGIPAGSVNTLYLLETTRGKFFLKIDEAKSMVNAQRELELLQFLRTHGLRCPQPLIDRNGQLLRSYHGKPLSLSLPLPGKPLSEPRLTPAHLTHVGQLLASLHLLSEHAPKSEENRFSFPRIVTLYQEVRDHLPGHFKQIVHTLDDEITYQQEYQDDRLPKGLIHGDLFADNLLFVGKRSSVFLTLRPPGTGNFCLTLPPLLTRCAIAKDTSSANGSMRCSLAIKASVHYPSSNGMPFPTNSASRPCVSRSPVSKISFSIQWLLAPA